MQPTPAVDVGRGGSVRNDKKTEKSLPEISCFPLPSRNAATNRQRKNALLALPTFLSVGVSSSHYLIFCVITRSHASKSHPLFKISDFLGEINSCFHRIKPCTSQLICRIYPKVRKEKRSSHLVSFHLILSIWPTYLRVVPTGGICAAFWLFCCWIELDTPKTTRNRDAQHLLPFQTSTDPACIFRRVRNTLTTHRTVSTQTTPRIDTSVQKFSVGRQYLQKVTFFFFLAIEHNRGLAFFPENIYIFIYMISHYFHFPCRYTQIFCTPSYFVPLASPLNISISALSLSSRIFIGTILNSVGPLSS